MHHTEAGPVISDRVHNTKASRTSDRERDTGGSEAGPKISDGSTSLAVKRDTDCSATDSNGTLELTRSGDLPRHHTTKQSES